MPPSSRPRPRPRLRARAPTPYQGGLRMQHLGGDHPRHNTIHEPIKYKDNIYIYVSNPESHLYRLDLQTNWWTELTVSHKSLSSNLPYLMEGLL